MSLSQRSSRAIPGAADFGIIDLIREVNITGVPRHISPNRHSDSRTDILRDMAVYRPSEGVIAVVYDDVSDSVKVCTKLEKANESLADWFLIFPESLSDAKTTESGPWKL